MGRWSFTLTSKWILRAGDEFLETMKHVRMVYLRNGAFSWRLHEDLGRVNTYRIEIMVPSWSQYLLQSARLTKAEKIILERARSFHVGSNALGEQMFLASIRNCTASSTEQVKAQRHRDFRLAQWERRAPGSDGASAYKRVSIYS